MYYLISIFNISYERLWKAILSNMNVKRLLEVLMIIISSAVSPVYSDIDYHPSSSAVFDEGKLSSISRFYKIGKLLFIKFIKIFQVTMIKNYSCYLIIISRLAFYFLEILECKFALISKYKKLLTAKKECHHTCLTQCHVNPGEKRVNSLMVEIVNFEVIFTLEV